MIKRQCRKAGFDTTIITRGTESKNFITNRIYCGMIKRHRPSAKRESKLAESKSQEGTSTSQASPSAEEKRKIPSKRPEEIRDKCSCHFLVYYSKKHMAWFMPQSVSGDLRHTHPKVNSRMTVYDLL